MNETLRMVAIVAASAGCVDFVAAFPPTGASQPTRLDVSVVQLPDTVALFVDLRIGRDSSGEVLVVARESLYVEGRPIPPRVRDLGRLSYSWVVPRDSLGTVVTVGPPAVAGARQPPTALVVPLVLVQSGLPARVDRGDDLVLAFSSGDPGPELDAVSPRSATFTLVAQREVIQLAWAGAPPDTVLIPAAWLAPLTNDSLHAHFQATSYFQAGTPWDSLSVPGAYYVGVTGSTSFRWTIVLASPMP